MTGIILKFFASITEREREREREVEKVDKQYYDIDNMEYSH